MISQGLKVAPVELPDQQSIAGTAFPVVLRCESQGATLPDVEAWIEQQRAELIDQAGKQGAILFRGFPVDGPEQLDRFIAAFAMENFPYEQSLSNAVRINYTPRVFSANEAPSEVTIYLHHEMAQTPIYPHYLFFYCQQPAQSGGATPLCRSDRLFDQMLQRCPEFANQCEQLGLKYTNVMPAADDAGSGMGRSWQSTLRTQDREQAERRLSGLGYSWQWLPDGCLKSTTPRLPAVHQLAPGRKAFFNQLIAASQGWKDTRNDPSQAVTFGDGSPLDRSAALLVAELAEQMTFDLNWQPGDVVLVDNLVVMHGRRRFEGKRKVLASLAAPLRHGS